MLVELTLKGFMEELASRSPAPGGGSASAAVGAMGAALVAMAAKVTLGKEKFKDREGLLQGIVVQAETARNAMLLLVDEDTQAFNGVAEVFRMPKGTQEEQQARAKAMEDALKRATTVPLRLMEEAVGALELCNKAAASVAKSVMSDIGVGALCLETALQGAWMNVRINLTSMKDKSFAEKAAAKADDLLSTGTRLAEDTLEKVRRGLG
ncbi:MAG: cyclodeaminase/cyclohydrolase family protein [Bacillota bacterium]